MQLGSGFAQSERSGRQCVGDFQQRAEVGLGRMRQSLQPSNRLDTAGGCEVLRGADER